MRPAPIQQAQFLHVQGLHLQPPCVASLAASTCCSVWVVIVNFSCLSLAHERARLLWLPYRGTEARNNFAWLPMRSGVVDEVEDWDGHSSEQPQTMCDGLKRLKDEDLAENRRVMTRDTISGLAKAAGVGVETVRYYQRRGLLAEPARPPGEVRRYSGEDVKRLRFIRSAQAAGFTLAEIGKLLDLDASDDRARARELAQARVAALDAKIQELREARDALASLASACAKKHGGPCPILRAFDRSPVV